jgi:hypothetical protein
MVRLDVEVLVDPDAAGPVQGKHSIKNLLPYQA